MFLESKRTNFHSTKSSQKLVEQFIIYILTFFYCENFEIESFVFHAILLLTVRKNSEIYVEKNTMKQIFTLSTSQMFSFISPDSVERYGMTQ